MSPPRTIRLFAEDDVVVAVDPIAAGSALAGTTGRKRVPRGTRWRSRRSAPTSRCANTDRCKYGQIMGFASRAIAPGEWVHEHDVALRDFARDYRGEERTRC